jgi:hypothetical protein
VAIERVSRSSFIAAGRHLVVVHEGIVSDPSQPSHTYDIHDGELCWGFACHSLGDRSPYSVELLFGVCNYTRAAMHMTYTPTIYEVGSLKCHHIESLATIGVESHSGARCVVGRVGRAKSCDVVC